MDIKIPAQLTSHHDVLRVIREVEQVEDFYTQADLKKSTEVPVFSATLGQIIAENKINLHFRRDRAKLGDALINIRDTAPQVHISFPVEPSPSIVEQITTWFRKEIDPKILVQIGIQPSIAAGCSIRTTNVYFDFSLRQHLQRNSGLLLEELRSLA